MMSELRKAELEFWDIARLKPYANNPKKHGEPATAKLAKAISAFRLNPIMVEPDGTIIAGHGRRLACLKLIKDGDDRWKTVPVFVRYDLTKREADALRLADNQVVDNDYDMAMVQQEISALADLGFDLDALGFDANELAFLTADLGSFDNEVFVEDISAAVETQKNENDIKAKEMDGTAAPVGDALGFKRVTVSQSRELRALMARIETHSGKQGPDALLVALRSYDTARIPCAA